jgi:hypothetical protein
MPRTKKPKVVAENPVQEAPVVTPETRDDVRVRESAPLSHAERIAESREALKHDLSPGQAFFEAPDGFIIVGDADRDHVLYRQGNNGQGMRINKRR